MGVFDFVKQAISAGMIARPDGQKQLIVCKHPDQNFPNLAQLTVDMDEVAVFFKDGQVVGVLPPGRHTLQTENIPFLAPLVNKFTGGNVFISELFFVRTTPVRQVPFGGPAGDIIDPATGLQVPLRVFGEMSVMVVDPVRFIVGYVGQARAGDNEEILRWIRGKFLNNVTTVLTRICEAEQKSVLSVINNREGLAQAFLERAPDLSEIGIRIVELGRIEPNIPDEHMRELREAVKELADAQRAVRKKQIAVAGAAADAQARQFELDQSFAQEQRQVQQLAGGNLQAYAASRMALGAAQGMAEHGVGGGVAGLGAQMAVGLGMGQMMGGAFAAPVAAPGGAPTAPSASPATASEVACLSCQTRQPPGKFCRECGTSLVPEKKFCRGCRLEVGASAKFCANCGSPQSL